MEIRPSLALKPYFELPASKKKRVMFTSVLNYFFFSNNCGNFSNKILPHCLTYDCRFRLVRGRMVV